MIYHPAVDTPALTVAHRAARLGALSDPLRLRIVDALTGCDRSPVELGRRLDVESNLLAHHLEVLEQAGLIAPGVAHGIARLDIGQQAPRRLNEVPATADLVVTVCDQAHEELAPPDTWLHWSIPDPVPTGTAAAFDATVTELRSRVSGLHGGGVER